MDKKVHTIIKLTKFKHLIQYLIQKQELNDLCLLLKLNQLQYQNYIPKNKDLLLCNKFTLLDSLQKYFNKTNTSINQSIKQNLLIQSNFPLKYMYILNNIAISQIYFPQIIDALSIHILNDMPIFTIYPTQLLLQALNSFQDFDSPFQTQELNFEIIIETILVNLINNYQQESFFKDAKIIQYISKLNFKLILQNSQSRIFYLLMKIKDLLNRDRRQTDKQNLDKNLLICWKYIEIYVNKKMAKPSLIKYLSISNNASNVYHLNICRQNLLVDLLQQNDFNLNQMKFLNYTCNQLIMQFPDLLNIQFQHSQIIQMLQLIYNKKDQIYEQLSSIFQQQNVIQLVNDIFMYNLSESCGFTIISQLNNYILDSQITSSVSFNNTLMRMTEIQRSQALSNLRLLLRMMVEQDIVIPELIQFIKLNLNKFSVYQFKMIQSRNMLWFFENDVRIMNLLQIYKVQVQRSGKKKISLDLKKVQLQINFYEFQCILNRMEALEKHKDKFKSELIKIFQLDTVKKLFIKLNLLRAEFTVEQQPYIHKGYKILIKIKRFLEENDE